MTFLFTQCGAVALLVVLVAGQQPQELVTATNYRTDDGQQRSESVDGQGNVRGEYSYVDPNGKTITVRYTAGKDGFRVEGDHLPQAPAAPQAAAPQQPQYNPQQYQPQPQYNPQQYQPQPQYQPQAQTAQQQLQNFPSLSAPNGNNLFNPNPQYNPQQYNQPQSQYQPQPQYNSAPQPQYNPFQHQQQPQQQQSQGGQVSVNQQPNGGFQYTFNI
ncbi:hypothetical protein B566_EDAN004816 [Ephemera danica]|nr:hypothetical protein B566_EDAN004816 [Ephemera danica]